MGTWAECKDYIRVADTALLAPSSTCDVKYRPHSPSVCVEVGEFSQVFGNLSIQTPGAKIKIGNRTQIGSCTIICVKEITIGDDVLCSWGITMMDSDNHSVSFSGRRNDVLMCGINYLVNPNDLARNRDWSDCNSAPIVIGNKVWIGFGVAILKGVTIGEGSIIGSQSVVTKDIPPYSIAAGNPAKVIRPLTPEEING